jgi:hypothetical protein
MSRDAVTRGGPKTREEIVNTEWHRDLSTPKVAAGDPAPDFALPVLGSGAAEEVRLSTFFGRKPVALIFGSYT